MEKLKKKTFYTVFSIISLFIIVSIIIFNVQNYHKEYKGIKIRLDYKEETENISVEIIR